MGNRMLKQVCLTMICLAILVIVFAVGPGLAQLQRGPIVDVLRRKVTRNPYAQLVEMTLGPPDGSDVWEGLRRPWHIFEMEAQSKLAGPQRNGFEMWVFGFNCRKVPLDDVNFRHALAHLVNKNLILDRFFRLNPPEVIEGWYMARALSTAVPPAQGLWYNDDVDPHPYAPDHAEEILAAAGYRKEGDIWMLPDWSPIPALRVYCPLEIVAPTSYRVATMFVNEANKIGLVSIILEPVDSSTCSDLVFNNQRFDIFLACQSLDMFPTHLYRMFHPANDYPGGENCYGVDYPELTAMLDILWTSLDHPAKLAAVSIAQELLMGGSTTDQLPTYVPPEDPRSQAIPVIPIYSRELYDSQSPWLRGAVNIVGYGINNMWTWMNIHWDPYDNDVPDYRPGTSENMVVYVHDEYPERLNPLFARTVHAWTFMDAVFDDLIGVNPWTHKDMPWLATSWSYVALPAGGMDVTFNLRLTDSSAQPIMCQDGLAISVDDVEFSWDFLHDWEIPKYWSAFRFYDPAHTVIVDADTIRARTTTTSQWLLYDLAGAAHMLPPQIWKNNPLTGDPWTSTAEILGFDPSAHAGPDGLPTMLYGTGPFVQQHSRAFILENGYGDLVANRDYWMTTEEIQDLLTEMFHTAGDVDYNGLIDGEDFSDIGLAWLTEPGDTLWNPDADICGPGGTPPDGRVDIHELSQAARFYKQNKTVPPPP